MLQNLKIFVKTHKYKAFAACVVYIVLITGIVIAAIVLLPKLENPPVATSQFDFSNSTTGNLTRTTTRLYGNISVKRNLKGLKLHINQIEFCNPKSKVISAYVVVSSAAGVVNRNFSKADVKLFLDNHEVDNFDFKPVDANKTKLTSMLVIDHSGSMAGPAIAHAKSAASSYVKALHQRDPVGIIQFDDSVDVLTRLSKNKQISIGAIGGIAASGNTAVYDALNKAIALIPDCGRAGVIVLTDGDDTSSSSDAQSVIENANKAKLPIFSVGVKGQGFDPINIKRISLSTGGQYLEANTPEQINRLYENIYGQLIGQFIISFEPSFKKDGSKHSMTVISNVEGSPTRSQRVFAY